MIFGNNKKLKEHINELEHQVKELSQIIKTQELLALRSENSSLKETVALLSAIQLKLKSTSIDPEDDNLIVRYEPIVLKVCFDEEGKVIKNNTFYSINKLRLTSLDDMKKVQAAIDELQKQKQN